MNRTKDYHLAKTHPGIAEQWHSTKNGTLTASEVMPGSDKKAWWRCDKGHDWTATIDKRTNGRGCPECWRLNRGEINRRVARTRRERLANSSGS